MAVELRCPKCKSKLRLPIDPEPDSEIECPKCEHVFPCEENIVHAGSDDDEKPKKAKKKKTDVAVDEDEAEKKPEKKPAAAPKKKSKRKKSKKKKTNPKVLIAIITGVVMVVGTVAGVLIWFFTKKSSYQEMMTYLPDDTQVVFGLNIGHMQKYPEFYKSCQGTFNTTGFQEAGDVLAKALGSEKMDDITDRLIQGTGYAGGSPSGGIVEATVFRTKEEFDQTLLSKIPGAKKYTADGVDYYTINPLPRLGYPAPRVFAPTSRVVVFCSGAIPENKFRLMLTGNKDNLDNTAYVKSGALGKYTIRGTVWRFTINAEKQSPSLTAYPPRPLFGEASGQNEEAKAWIADYGSIAQNVQGVGLKASVGSREIKGEWIVQYSDSDRASEQYKKWREKEWVKDDEKSAPRYWKTLANITGAGKTAENIIRDNLYFKSSSELFIVGTAVETKVLSISSVVGVFVGQQQGGGGMPAGGMPAGGMPPGGTPPGGMPPSRPRRRRWPARKRGPAATIPV